MKIKEATEILKSIGWRTYIGDGDRYALFELPDRIVGFFYIIKRATDYQQLSAMFSTSTKEFSTICSQVGNDKDHYESLVVSWKGIDFRDPEFIKPAHIHQASQQAIDWAKEQDLHQALLDYAALPTDAPGSQPILHLSALVLLGDIEKLKFYQTSFEAGDRLGFVPYITKDFIDRAVTLAEQNQKCNEESANDT